MKDEKFLTRSAFRLLALLLCLTASIPQLWALDFYVKSSVTTWDLNYLLNDNYKMTQSNGEWTWSYTATSNSDLYFRMRGRDNNSWYNDDLGAPSDGTSVITDYQNCSWNNNNAWKIAVTAGNTYTFYLRNSNGNYQVKYSAASVPPTPHYYVTGDSGLGLDGWSPNPQLELTDSDNDGIYTYTATASATGTYGFVFANGQVNNDWNTFNSNYRIGPTNGNETATLNGSYQNTQLAGGDHGHYNVTVAAGTVTFSLNTNTTPMQFKVEGTAPATYNYTFYVKKNDALTSSPYLYLWDSNQNDLNGGWPGTNTNVTEVLADEKTWYKFTGAYIVQSVNAIVNKGNGQNQTNDITGLTPGTYYITWDGSNKDDNGLVVTTTAPTAIIYYVVGDEALIGHDWAIGSDVVMTNNSWSKTGIHLNMGTYNLKVLDSEGYWYGDNNGNNVSVTAPENGTYTLTVTRDPSTGVVSATLNRTAIDATQAYNIYVRYTGNESPSNVYMHAWNSAADYDTYPGITLSEMSTETINGHTYYKYTINTTASSIGLLFNENGSNSTQTESLTAQPGNSYFTYGGGSTISGPNSQADEPTPTYNYTIYVRYKGTATPYMHLWDDSGDKLGSFPGTALTDANTFSTEVINGYTYYKYTVTESDHSSMGMILSEGSAENKTNDLEVEPGTSYWTYGGGSIIYGPNSQADPAITTYYAATDIYNWTIDEGSLMTYNSSDGSYSKTFTGISLNAGSNYGYKVFGANDGTNEGVWFGDAQGNNATFSPSVSGTYNVTITLNSDGTISHTLTLTSAAPIYITGSSGLGLGWSHDNPTAMTYDQSTGYYTYIYQVTDSGTYNFVFANGTSDNWDDFNTQYRIGPSGATDVSITPNNNWNNTQMANGSNKAYSVKLNPGTVTITFDPTTNNMRFKVDGHILTHNYTFFVLPSDHYSTTPSTPYMYLWGLGTDEAFHYDYPGTALTRTAEPLDDGNYWYMLSVDLTAEFIHALVNGGINSQNADDTKTADITHIDPGTYYIYWTTTREDGQQYNDYILTNVPPTHPGGTLYMIGTYYYDKHQYNYDPNSGVQMKYDANSQTYYLNNVNLAVNNTFCFTTNLSANWENVGIRYGNGGPTYTVGDNTTNYFEINENYINKKLNLDEWNENYGEFRITVPGIYNVLVNPEGKWVQLIKTDYYALTPMNVFLEQTPNVTMPADYIQPPGTEYTNLLFNGGNWPLAAYNEANGGGQWDPTDNGNHYPVTFIGDTVTADGKHWWHWQVNASIAEIFFTRTNEPNQSNIIRRKSGVLWVTWDEVNGESTLTDHSREYFEAAANALPTNAVVMEGHYYVYFINTVDWDKVYCYAWDNNPVLDDQGNPVYDGQGNPVIDNYFHDGYSRQMNDWPGQPCELVGIDPVTGYEVWRYDFGTIIGTDIPNGGIIFNDGNEYAETEAKEQTGDFEYINGAVYDYLGMVDGAYTLNNLIRTAAEEVRYTVSNDLLAVYYDPKAVTRIDYKNAYEEDVHEYITGALYAKDLNQYGEKSIMPDSSYTDYVYQTCASNHTSGRSQIMIKRTTYDQSNWVKLVMSPNYDNRHEVVAPGDRPNLEDYVGHIIPAGTLDVFMTDTINPTAHVLAIQMGETMSYEPNVYISSHFNDTVVFNYTHKDWQLGEYNGNYRTQPHITWTFNEENQAISGVATRELVSEDPYYMYYVAPKPQEIAYITWVVYDNYNMDNAWPGYCKHTQWTGEGGWSYQPYTTPNPHVIPPEDPGRFYAPMNWNRRTEIPGEAYDQLQYLAGDVLDKALGAWDPDYGPYSNGYMQYGAMKVNWSLFQEETPWWQIFTPGQAYKFMAIIRYARGSGYNPDPESGDINDTADNYYYGPSIGYFEDGEEHTYSDGHTVFNAPRRDNDNGLSGYANMYFCGDYTDAGLDRSKFIIFPIKASAQRSNGDGMGNVTAIHEVISDVTSTRTVVGVSYYNLMGVKSDKPFDGINIVVTNYSDGSCSSRKILR